MPPTRGPPQAAISLWVMGHRLCLATHEYQLGGCFFVASRRTWLACRRLTHKLRRKLLRVWVAPLESFFCSETLNLVPFGTVPHFQNRGAVLRSRRPTGPTLPVPFSSSHPTRLQVGRSAWGFASLNWVRIERRRPSSRPHKAKPRRVAGVLILNGSP